MADWSSSSQRSGGGRSDRGQASVDYGELEEEDVWSAVKGRGGGGDYSRGLASATPRTIPGASHVATETGTPHQSSAPMNIPDWSKIYRKSNGMVGGSSFSSGSGSYGPRDMEEGEGEEEDGMVPPHEWIARKLARTQISSSSMCEGMGRTLKGRDLSKVRNAILTKTGFLE